jgi:hypothetical protein
MIRALLAAVLLALVAAAPAAAKPPDGDWTFVRKDSYVHYACKQVGKGGGLQVRTASWYNGKSDMIREYPADAAIASGSNKDADYRSTKRWVGGFARITFRGVSASDRLWMQADGYGPPEPWSDGYRVARLTDCA